MTPDAFRRLALELDGASEASHMNHPDFRVAKRVFATLGYPDPGWGMIALTPLQQSQFVRAHPKVFSPIRGGWGLRGATGVALRVATVAPVREALFVAWCNVAPKSLAATDAPPSTRRARRRR